MLAYTIKDLRQLLDNHSTSSTPNSAILVIEDENSYIK